MKGLIMMAYPTFVSSMCHLSHIRSSIGSMLCCIPVTSSFSLTPGASHHTASVRRADTQSHNHMHNGAELESEVLGYFYTHTIYLRPAAEPKGLLTLSDTTLLMLHRGLTSPCAFFDSLLHAACCPRQSPCVISTSLVLYLSSLIRRLWVSIAAGRLAQSRLLQEIPQVFSVLSAAAEALSALLHKAVDEFVLVGEIHPVPGC